MNLLPTLKESVRLLIKKPVIFIPNLFASLLYASVELIILKIAMDSMEAAYNPHIYLSPEELQSRLLIILGIISFFPAILAVDLITYSMYPSIVADYHKDGNIHLWKALKDALSAWRIWLSLGMIFLAFTAFALIIEGFFAALTILLNNILYLIIGLLLLIPFVILFMMTVFFVIPLGVIEKTGILESFRKSYQLGFRHRREVVSLNVFIILVIATAFIFGNIPGTGKMAEEITVMAVALFLTVKIIQSLTYTYICVVNPYFYIGISRQTAGGEHPPQL